MIQQLIQQQWINHSQQMNEGDIVKSCQRKWWDSGSHLVEWNQSIEFLWWNVVINMCSSSCVCLFDVFFVSCLEVFRSCASSLRNSMLSSVTAIEDDAIQGVSSNDDVSSDMKDIIWRENQHCWVFIIWNSSHVDLQRD